MPGNIDKETKDKSIQSHYFIKFDNELTQELFDKLKKLIMNLKKIPVVQIQYLNKN